MNKQTQPRPTDAELEILQVLWVHGPATVREVHETLPKKTGYTTTLKLLQKMTEKGLVKRDESNRSHVYRAARNADVTQKQLVSHLVQAAFGGSPGKLVLHALSGERASDEELAEIRRLLAEMESKRRKS